MLDRLLSRRNALKTVFWGTVTSNVLRETWSGTVINEVRAAQNEKVATLKITLSDFPALTQAWGSVRVGTSSIANNFPTGLYYPVIINRGANDDFYALNAECTHAGCVVPTFDADARVMECPCHFSRYRIDGVVVGGPANFPLTKYNVRANGNGELLIEIPDLILDVTVAKVMPPNTDRLELEFLAFAGIQYEVRFISALGGTDETAPFSTTPSGPLTQTVLDGGDVATIYVAKTSASGFYQVAMKTRPV